MEPIKFEHQTKELSKPEGWTDEECGALPVWTNGKQCISCWKPSIRERLSILFFGKVWLWVFSGQTQPPVAIDGKREMFEVVITDAPVLE